MDTNKKHKRTLHYTEDMTINDMGVWIMSQVNMYIKEGYGRLLSCEIENHDMETNSIDFMFTLV